MDFIIGVLVLISGLMFVGLIFCIIMFFKSLSKSKNQTSSIVNSNGFRNIANYIFNHGRPALIIITVNNEIIFGPFNNTYHQVPGNLVPPMDHLERYSLGNAFAQQYNYQSDICFGPQGQNLGTCRTGNGYIDSHADIVISGSAATGSW